MPRTTKIDPEQLYQCRESYAGNDGLAVKFGSMTALITAGAKIVAYEPLNPAAPIAAIAAAPPPAPKRPASGKKWSGPSSLMRVMVCSFVGRRRWE